MIEFIGGVSIVASGMLFYLYKKSDDRNSKNKYKKYLKLSVAVFVIMMIISIGTSGSADDSSDSSDSKPSKISSSKPVEFKDNSSSESSNTVSSSSSKKGTNQSSSHSESSNNDIDTRAQTALVTYQDKFNGMATFSYDKSHSTIEMTPTGDYADAMIKTVQSGEKSSWEDNVVEKFNDNTKSDAMEDISITILNPTNTKNTLLLVKNGIVMYDVMGDE